METQLHILTLFLLLNPTSTAWATVKPPANNPFDFIRSSCNATLYPDICYTSLSRYATAVQRQPLHLASFAISVSLTVTQRASAHFTNLTHHHQAHYGPTPLAASALRDCCSAFADAVDQMRGSLERMRQLGRRGGTRTGGPDEEVRFRLSDVQTWMSAALTNEDPCSDGFADVDDSCPFKADVTRRVDDVTKLTSNALALVNSFANSLGS